MPPVQSPETTWREVTARVHVSLSPQDLATRGKAAATHNAFRTLLMRYSTPLRGVPVAHRGPLDFKSPAVFVGASPYAHIVATARLLVFSPPRGTVFVGVVKHVGPDHVGLSVLHAFHAVLPLEPLRHVYAYDYHFGEDGLVRRWRCVNETSPFNHQVTLGRHIRFVVEGIHPSHTGLFQIHASLNEDIRRETHRPDEPLGVQDPAAELSTAADDTPDIHNEATSGNADLLPNDETTPAETVDVLSASRRSSGSRARVSAVFGDDPFNSNVFGDALSQTPFGTALAPVSTPTPKTDKKKKKQKHTSSQRQRSKTLSPKVEARSVKFEQVQVALGHEETNGATAGGLQGSQGEASQWEASQAEASQAEASQAEASKAEASQAEASQAEASQVGVLTQADVASQTDVASQSPSQSSQKRKETKEERRKRREEKRLRKQARKKAAMEAALFAQIGTQVDRPPEIGSDAAAHTGQGGSGKASGASPRHGDGDGSPAASGPPANRMAQMRTDALRAVAVGQLAESKLATQTKVKEEVVVEENVTAVGSQESSGSRKGKKRRKRKRETAVATVGAEGGTGKKRKKRQKVKREPVH